MPTKAGGGKRGRTFKGTIHKRHEVTEEKRFHSMAELVQAAQRPEVGTFGRKSREAGAFACSTSFAEAVRLAQRGWPEGTARLKHELGAIQALLAPSGYSYTPAEEGDDVIVERFLDGEVETAMLAVEVAHAGAPPIELVINTAVDRALPQKVIVRRGAAIAALVAACEASGRAVGVTLVSASSRSWVTQQRRNANEATRYTGVVWVCLKEVQEPLDLDLLTFALAHPAFDKRLINAVCEQFGDTIRSQVGYTAWGNYGIPWDVEPPAGAIYIDAAKSYQSAWQTPEAAVAKVKELLKQQAILVEG